MKKKISLIIVSSIITATVLAGCGSSSASNGKYEATAESYSDYGYAAEEAYYDDVYEYEAPMVNKNMDDSADAMTDDEVNAATNRKLIKNVNMDVETKEFDTLVDNVEKKIVALGGYAESINISGSSSEYSSTRNANITARIPAANLDSFVTSVEEKSNITSKNESTEDVTLTYADVEAHKKSLKIEQDRLNDLLEEADSLETILALESRLTEVRYELESYESRLRAMDNQVQYSTVYLYIREVKEYQPEPVEKLTFGQRLTYEFSKNCIEAWETVQDFIIGFIAFLPILLVLVLILAVIGLVIFVIIKIIIAIVKKISSSNKSKSKNKAVPVKAQTAATNANDNAQQDKKAEYATALDEKPVIENGSSDDK